MQELKIEKVGKAYRFKTKSGDYVDIGEPTDEKFHPQLKINRWNKECSFKLKFDDKDAKEKSCKLEDNKVKWKSKDFDFHFYPVEEKTVRVEKVEAMNFSTENILPLWNKFTQNELGGLEFEIILKKKPSSNKIVLSIETHNLKVYYQPPLHPDHPTWADRTGDGVMDTLRPENVVGSYAVYHATIGNTHKNKADAEKYKTGLAFHIYRPEAFDANENKVWCDLYIDEQAGTLTITIPQEFLDGATYPVIIDPNFGYEIKGGTKADIMNVITGSVFTIPVAGDADSITAYVDDYNGAVGSKHKCAIYLHADSSLEDSTVEVNAGTWRHTWVVFAFTVPPPLLATTAYVLVGWADIDCWMYYNAGDANQGHTDGQAYDGYPANANFVHDNNKYSIYCTYSVPVAGAQSGSVIPILLDTLVKLKPFGSQPFKPFKSRFPTFTPRW